MNRFFISGCQRSGTTMLRLVLESHPSIHCFDEAAGYDLLLAEAIHGRAGINVKVGAKIVGFKIPRFSEQLTRPVFSDPLYGEFPSFYRDDKVIFIFREALDVVASMMRLKADAERSWLDRYGMEILRAMISNQPDDSIYMKDFEYIDKSGFPEHLVGALYWKIKNQGFFDLIDRKKTVYPVKYEEFVSQPQIELAGMCEFLGLEWSDSLLKHPDHPHGELDENGKAIGETDPLRGIDSCSVGGYHSLLTEEKIMEIRDFVKPISDRINIALHS